MSNPWFGGVSSGAITSINWLHWERRRKDKRNLAQWKALAGVKVAGSRRIIMDTGEVTRDHRWDAYHKSFGGSVTGRLARNVTATQVAALQQQMFQHMEKKLTPVLSHQADAMAYAYMGSTMKGMEYDWLWFYETHAGCTETYRPITHEFYERTGSWRLSQASRAIQSRLALKASTVSGPSPSGMSLSVLARSGRVPSWKTPGGRSRTRSVSTA